MMLYNKNNFLNSFGQNRKQSNNSYENIKENMYKFYDLVTNIWLLLTKEKKSKNISMKLIWKTTKLIQLNLLIRKRSAFRSMTIANILAKPWSWIATKGILSNIWTTTKNTINFFKKNSDVSWLNLNIC